MPVGAPDYLPNDKCIEGNVLEICGNKNTKNGSHIYYWIFGRPGQNGGRSADQPGASGEKANALGHFDAIIHNAAVGYREPRKITTANGLPHLFAINSLAPFLLTTLIHKPQRLIYISSGLHRDGDSSLEDLLWEKRSWSGYQAYADSKLHNVLLAFAIADKWKDVHSNALEPGWVATKMGGPSAPDNLAQAPLTQVWLASANDPEVLRSGGYFYHKKPQTVHPDAEKREVQELFLEKCARISGISFPESL